MNKLAVIGAGSMAEALISGIVENNLVQSEQIWVTNRQNQERLAYLNDLYKVRVSYIQEEILNEADLVILAMKPKDAQSAISRIKHLLKDNMLIVSLLAGVSIDTIEKLAEKPLPIVRAMPNTSAAVGKSATALAVNDKVTNQQKKLVKGIFDTVGFTAFVNEDQIDAVTGLSGSGPAYIYYLVEAAEKSAARLGLEKELAKSLIIQTLVGAAMMLEKSPKTPEQLRKEVTSPGGTTEAGLKVLEEYHIQDALIKCIHEAAAQSRRLGEMLTKEITCTGEKVTY